MNENLMVYGFPEKLEILEALLPCREAAILTANYVEDLITAPYFASIVNVEKLTEKKLRVLFDYYTDVSDPVETPILIGISKDAVPAPLSDIFITYDSFETARDHLKYDLLSAYRKQKKCIGFNRTITNALIVLYQIRKNPGISTEKLADLLELFKRTVQRYIELLRISGEYITYNTTLKGWTLLDGKSVLFGDFEDRIGCSSFGAEWFFRRFTESVTWEKYANTYKKDADFTPVVTSVINGIIEDGIGWQHQNEYFRIDAVGWETRYTDIKEETNKAGLNAHLWDLRIAVEHENNKQDWTDEIVKLMQIRCPLKVVIGYNHCDQREENEKRKLEITAKLIQATDFYPSITRDREEILLILGNGCSAKTGKSDYTSFDYRGYLYHYETEKFVRLNGQPK